MLLFTATLLGWPARLVSENFTDVAPSGHVTFQTWASVDNWKAANEALRPENQNSNTVTIPQSVDLWKLRTVLDQLNLTQLVISFINAQSEPPRIALRNAFEYFGEPVSRSSHLVTTLVLGGVITSELMDTIFLKADGIT